MAGGYSVLNALNKNTRQQAEEKPQGRFRTRDISISDIYANAKNFYGTRDIETLAADIQAVGLLENLTVVYAPKDGRNYKLVGGERRWRALNLLVEQGYNEFSVATCQIRNADDDAEEVIEIIMCNRQRVKTAWEQLEEERQLKECLSAIKKRGGTVSGVDLQSGRLRENIAKMLECSSTKVAQMEAIINNLIPEFMDALKAQQINFSAAYVISGMQPEQQQEALKRCQAAGGTITSAEAKEIKQEAEKEAAGEAESGQGEESTEKEHETPDYGADQMNVESICYRCSHWEECIEKSNTTVKCATFEDKNITDHENIEEVAAKVQQDDLECCENAADYSEQDESVVGLTESVIESTEIVIEEEESVVEQFDSEKYEEISDLSDLDIVKQELDKENRTLELMLKEFTENDIRIRKQKLLVGALAAYLWDLDEILNAQPEPEQPELPILRNNDQRKAFIDAYMDWPVWIDNKDTGERYYRYDFENGASFVVKVYFHRCFDYSMECEYENWEDRYKPGFGSEEYYILVDGKFFKDCLANKSALVEYLKNVQKGDK